jgi:hypothetical protein
MVGYRDFYKLLGSLGFFLKNRKEPCDFEMSWPRIENYTASANLLYVTDLKVMK